MNNQSNTPIGSPAPFSTFNSPSTPFTQISVESLLSSNDSITPLYPASYGSRNSPEVASSFERAIDPEEAIQSVEANPAPIEYRRNDAVTNPLNMPYIPTQSCYCVVCTKCFFCKKSYYKRYNTFCLCKNTLLPFLPVSQADNAEVMQKYIFKRAYTIDWVKRHADDTVYDLGHGFQIDNGNLVSFPLCGDHHQEFERDWTNYTQDYSEPSEGLGIATRSVDDMAQGFPLPDPESEDCRYRFCNWTISRPRDIRSLTMFPAIAEREHLLPLNTDAPTTFGDLFRDYFNMTDTDPSQFLQLRFYNHYSETCYDTTQDMKDVFRTSLYLQHTFSVELQQDLFTE